jgi:ribosomal protein L11 methylase PrmA
LKKKTRARKFSKKAMLGLVDSLGNAVRRLRWAPRGTQWVDYYEDTNYSPPASNHKKEIVAQLLDILQPRVVWDFGGNVGILTRMAADRGAKTISFDMDPGAVEINYLENVKKNGYDLLPLVLDLTNPSPNLGWESQERMSIFDRGPADTGLALALIHHLVVSNNLPLGRIASFFGKMCNSLIIEFIPSHDSQIQRLLRRRRYIWHEYTQHEFENEFSKVFTINDSLQIRESERIIYVMTRKEN